MKKKKLWGMIGLLAALGLATALILSTVVSTRGTTDVLMAAKAVAKGSRITETDLTKVSVNRLNLPANIVREKEKLVGKYAAVDLVSGDLLLQSKVSSSPVVGDAQLNDIPSGKLAVSCAIPNLSAGLSGKLQPGDIIRIYQYKDGATTLYPELTYMQVIAVTDANGKAIDEKSESGAAAITVIASSEQVKAVAKLDHEGGTHLALITRGDKELAQQLLQEQDNLNSGKGGTK